MTDKPHPSVTTGKARIDLPEPFLTEIGRVITRWAYYERMIQSCIRDLIGVSAAEARLALREPRVTERLELMAQLMQLYKGEWDETLYKSIYSRTKRWGTRRDLIAHGVWGFDEKEECWRLEVIRGKWSPELFKLFRGHRRVMPAAIKVTIEDHLHPLIRAIDGLIKDLEALKTSSSWQKQT